MVLNDTECYSTVISDISLALFGKGREAATEITSEGSCVGSGGRAVERWTVNRGDGGSIPPTAVSKLAISFIPLLSVSFGRDTKHRWSLLPGVCARESKML